MENTSKNGFWRNAGLYLGFIAPTEERSEHQPILLADGSAVLPRFSDSTVTGSQALSLVGVYRAVSILSTATKQLPINVYRGGTEIDSPALIKQPNVDTHRPAFIEQTVTSMALTGNAYWFINRQSPTDAVNNIEVWNPHLVSVEQDEKSGKVKAYHYGDKTYPAWKVKHLRLLRVPGSHLGLGPVQSAQNSLRGSLDLRDYATNWFRDGGAPNGVLKTDQVLSPDDMLKYQDAWDNNSRSGKTRIIGSGLNYTPIYLSPRDAQFLESQQFTRSEIAALFGVPAIYMLADGGSSMTYTNSIQVDIAFVRYTLTQYLTEIEQALSELLPRGQDARFVVEGLQRADAKTRYEGYAVADWMTVNEKRAIEGLPPIEGGDELTKPQAPSVPQAPQEPEGGSN